MVVQVRLRLRGSHGRVVVARKDAHRLEAADQLGRSVAGRREMSFRPTRGCPRVGGRSRRIRRRGRRLRRIGSRRAVGRRRPVDDVRARRLLPAAGGPRGLRRLSAGSLGRGCSRFYRRLVGEDSRRLGLLHGLVWLHSGHSITPRLNGRRSRPPRAGAAYTSRHASRPRAFSIPVRRLASISAIVIGPSPFPAARLTTTAQHA